MGFAASGQCFASVSEAASFQCVNMQGAYSQTCFSVSNVSASSASLNFDFLDASGQQQTGAMVFTPSPCDVPNPVQDAALFSGAVVGLWITVAAVMVVVRLFRVPSMEP